MIIIDFYGFLIGLDKKKRVFQSLRPTIHSCWWRTAQYPQIYGFTNGPKKAFEGNWFDEIIEQITKQQNKMIDVIKVVDLENNKHIERELVLVKIMAKGSGRDELKRLVDIFRGRVIDVTETTYTIELTGNGDKVNAFIEALDKKSIIEVVRSGVSGIARGDKGVHV